MSKNSSVVKADLIKVDPEIEIIELNNSNNKGSLKEELIKTALLGAANSVDL